jgi:hypothetical protein
MLRYTYIACLFFRLKCSFYPPPLLNFATLWNLQPVAVTPTPSRIYSAVFLTQSRIHVKYKRLQACHDLPQYLWDVPTF